MIFVCKEKAAGLSLQIANPDPLGAAAGSGPLSPPDHFAALVTAGLSAMNILVADDHPLYREALASILEGLENDICVTQAATLDEVVQRVSERGVAFDLVLLDLYMGAGDWRGVIETLSRSCPTTSVIVISGSDSRDDAERALRAGACGYIPKSMKKEDMLSAIRLILMGGVRIQPRDEERAAGVRDAVAPGLMPSDASSRIAMLTSRQRDVLFEIGAGKSNKLIARSLGMAEGTVKLHVAAILKCLGTENRTQAAIMAHQLNLTPSQHH